MLILLKRLIARSKGAAIRVHDIRVGSIGVVVALGLEVEVLRICSLYISCFSIRVSLVDLFRPHFKLLMEASLGLVIILDKDTVCL